jgi:hypothetical protein
MPKADDAIPVNVIRLTDAYWHVFHLVCPGSAPVRQI